MAKEKEKPPVPETDSQTGAMVLFGDTVQMLPSELQAMGLAGKVEVREVPGIVPTWKPVNQGDFLLGRCVSQRAGVGKFHSTVLVFETAVPGGFRSVWLGADLKVKLNDPVGKVFSIKYEGTQQFGAGQPMKMYQVCEVMPVLAMGS